MKKVKSKQNKISRQDLADPLKNMSYYERLKIAKAIDLTNNYIIEELEDEYIRIKAIDKNKIVQ